MSEFEVTLHANINVSSKSLKIEQNSSQGLEALKTYEGTTAKPS